MKGLYIHIPFCIKKCKYCDFTSYSQCSQKEEYLSALFNEMHEYKGTDIDTVFIGGGTPSILSPKQIEELMRNVRKNFNLTSDCEISMEANPGTLDADKIRAMYDMGINRVSVGVQSFNDDELNAIGRIHNADMAYNNILQLRNAGFENINIDIMSALPFQSKQTLLNTLKKTVLLPITHISAYSLILEEGTPLKNEYENGEFTLPSDDEDREMYAITVDFLKKHGFGRYEISNFAKEGYECKHNLKYWKCNEYIGLGVSAHSYIGNKRFSNTDNLQEYINGAKRDIIILQEHDKISEFMIMGFRTQKGVGENEFKMRFGKDLKDVYQMEIEKFIKLGLLSLNNGYYSLTDRGFDISNSIMSEFIIINDEIVNIL